MPRVRISHYKEFDNGHVLHNYKKMDIEDAELLARDASLKDPDDIYYVAIDNVMDPSTDYRWINGKKYRYDQVGTIHGMPYVKSEFPNIMITIIGTPGHYTYTVRNNKTDSWLYDGWSDNVYFDSKEDAIADAKNKYPDGDVFNGSKKESCSSKINIRKLVESKLFEARLSDDDSYDMNWKLMDYETASQADIFGVEWAEEIDSSKPVYEDESGKFNFWCYTNNDGEVVVSKSDPVTGEEDIKIYDSYKDAGVEINEADLAQWQRYVRLANGKEESKEPTERQKLNSLRKSDPKFDSKYNELKAELKRMAGVARRNPGAPVEDARKKLDDFLKDNGIDPYKL